MRTRPCIIVVILNVLIAVVDGVNPGNQCVAFESSYHIDRACECVMYQSYGRSQGTFTSPNFPRIYPPNINCILYTFIGDLDEIVELSFLEFDLQASVSSKCSDFLRFFLDLERPEVNERHSWNYELCGNISTIVQKKHYSSTRSLILELHTDGQQANNSGFRGIFKFLDKTHFEITGGNKRFGQQCVYDFYSSTSVKAGRFFSPRYPQNYPPSAKCTYTFYAARGEHVKVSFQNIQLEVFAAASDCAKSPDIITVRDGTDSGAPVLARFCNTHNAETVMSSGESLVVELAADDRKQRQGFAATFHFVKEHYVDNLSTTLPPLLLPPASDEGRPSSRNKVKGDMSGDKGPGSVEDASRSSPPLGDCVYQFSSLTEKSGNFSSPNHPQPYGGNTECRYIFEGQGRERVQIIINVLDLHYSDGNPSEAKECTEEVDSLTVNTYINGHPHSIAIYCGRKRPDKLMSSDTRLDVIFVAHSSQTTSSGFHAFFRFVTDYGMESGTQENGDSCSFRFKSDSLPNGTFTSPNFPGIYPRNTECNYIFYGRHDEKIYIKFAYFDVEGIESCSTETQSDYVEISNFNVHMSDRKLGRMCGRNWRRGMFMSDNNFFRVTFKSNNVYDATGFSAFYQFRTNDNSQNAVGRSPPLTGSSSGSRPTSPVGQSLGLALTQVTLVLLCSLRTT